MRYQIFIQTEHDFVHNKIMFWLPKFQCCFDWKIFW